MTALFIAFAIAGMASYLAVLRRSLLFSIGGMVGWIALWAMIKAHPPLGITDGEAAHILLQLAPWVIGIGVMLYSAQKEITRQRDLTGNFSWTESGGKMPKIFGGKDEEDEEKERRSKGMTPRQIRNNEYRLRVRSAYGRRGRS